MRSRIVILLLFCLVAQPLWATHIRGGEITARRDVRDPLKFYFTLTIYTLEGVGIADDANNTLFFGDGASQTSPRLIEQLIDPENRTTVNIYEYEHQYTSAGEYKVFYRGDNRNASIKNIRNSVTNNFYIETKIIAGDPFLGINNTPVLVTPAYEIGALNQIVIHNPGAYDPDGDSLSYSLVICRQYSGLENGPISTTDYVFPNQVAIGGLNKDEVGPATFTVDSVTGNMVWDVPREVGGLGGEGMYNAALRIDEWRDGDTIGYVIRDLQIIIEESKNTPPTLTLPNDTCVIAGDTLLKKIVANDADTNELLKLFMFEGAYELPPGNVATFTVNPTLQPPEAEGTFFWNPGCLDVRKEPYNVVFQVSDQAWSNSVFTSLDDIAVWRINVIAPPPNLDTLTAINGQVELFFRPYAQVCDNAEKVEVWRKIGSDDFTDTCNTEILPLMGYELIGEVGIDDTVFVDNNQGQGLRRGRNYCYRLQAIFPQPGKGKSVPSAELCAMLPLDVPVINKVSVVATDVDSGIIEVGWTQPIALDSSIYPGPYQYRLFRLAGNNQAEEVYRTNNLTDTTFTDSLLNTFANTYSYRINFYYGMLANLKDSSEAAGSVWLQATPQPNAIGLSWQAQVPWQNDGYKHYIYRDTSTQNTPAFALIDSIETNSGSFTYTDVGNFNNQPLIYGTVYCYKVLTQGGYGNPVLAEPLLNYSQVVCATVLDTITPCQPLIRDTFALNDIDCFDCNFFGSVTSFKNRIAWYADVSGDCEQDVIKYNVYYARYLDDETQYLATTNDTVFIHNNIKSLAGCYQITSVDASGNESPKSRKICTDNCAVYELPNVITPGNNDNLNQDFGPYCRNNPFVKKVDITIYNRWGVPVYSGQVGANIEWPGVDNQGHKVTSGVYYYHAKVYTERLDRNTEVAVFKGWLQVFQ